MKNYYISINQLAEFESSSSNKKNRIIKQQKVPNKLLVPWYQLPKARIRKSIEQNGNMEYILEAINILNERECTTPRSKTDKKVSLEALEKYINTKLPRIIEHTKFEVIKTNIKKININEVDIIISPEVIVKGKLNGSEIIVAVKIHISKNNPFDLQKSKIVASAVYEYLNNQFSSDKVIIRPEYCFCYDVFSRRFVKATSSNSIMRKKIEEMCLEIKTLWNEAA